MSDQESQNETAQAAEEAEIEETEETAAEAQPLDVEALKRELEKARKQAARYRRERNELRERLGGDPAKEAEKRAQDAERRARIVEALAEKGVPVALYRALRELETAEDVPAAVDAIAQLLPQPQRAVTALPKPAVSGNLSVDDLIAEAERSGDTRRAIALKTQKLMGGK